MIPGPLSPEIKRIERYEVLVDKSVQARTKTIIPVAALSSPFVYYRKESNDWAGIIYIIKALGIPIKSPR